MSRIYTNISALSESILEGFSHLPNLWGLLFSLFLVIYLLTMAGNLLIVELVSVDATLQSPMHFFL